MHGRHFSPATLLTFDLADASKLSLSFYGKRPGTGMTLDKQSLQFALHEIGRSADLLENPPPGTPLRAGFLGPNAIHQLIAHDAWRLPFERAWRSA